jgi:hypothetical protein
MTKTFGLSFFSSFISLWQPVSTKKPQTIDNAYCQGRFIIFLIIAIYIFFYITMKIQQFLKLPLFQNTVQYQGGILNSLTNLFGRQVPHRNSPERFPD